MSITPPSFRDTPSNLRRGMAPKYGVLAEALRQRIARGIWPEGTCLPSLNELAEEFGVARLTARQAVQVLVQEGLLESMQGRGTYVTRGRTPIKTIEVQTTLRALADMYVRTPPEILTLDERIVSLPPHIGTGNDRPFVRIRRVHSEGGVPYCVIAVHIDAGIFNQAAQEFRNSAAIPVLVAKYGSFIARAHQTLTVRAVDAETSTHLGVPLGAPAAYVERTFEAPGGKVLYFAEVIYRGDLVKLDIELQV
ncbi:GntR family transcriptional regulator [Cupriavidus sp. CP313]